MAHQKVDLFHEQWKIMLGWVNMYLEALSDEDLKTELVSGKNHGVWILGHLIASDDDLSLYLDKGPMLFPEYQTMFKQGSSLKSIDEYPSVALLREQWKQVCDKNEKIYEVLTDEELEQPHALVNGNMEDDYFKTKERCLMNWTLHQMHHAGQLAVLLAKTGRKRLV